MSGVLGALEGQPVAAVVLLAGITALATGLGALPFLFLRSVSPRAEAYSSALAGGLMLGATFGLVVEGSRHGEVETLAGGVLGALFVLVSDRLLGEHQLDVDAVTRAGARRMVLIVLVMTIHSFSEGIAVGASFAGEATLAAFVTLAIAVHNIPEGLAISAVLRPQGVDVSRCAAWSVFSSLPQPLMAVPAFLFVDAFRPALPYALGFAAGAMVYMVLDELLPGAYRHGRRPVVGILITLSLFAMILLQRYL